MGKYSKIAVIYGSDSSEWEVSCRSGEFTASRIDGTEYDVYEIFARFGKWQLVAMKKRDAMRIAFPEGSRPEIDKTDFSVRVLGEKIVFDFAFIMQHGTPGENGLLQGYFEMLGIPFSTCSAFVSTVVFDKFACKSYLRDEDFVKTAPDVFVRKGMDMEAVTAKIVSKLKFPVFVKPTDAGSSFGITKVKAPEDLPEAIRFAFSEGQMVIVEQGLVGRELTCAAYTDSEGVKALPVIEIVTENEYFDYDAKYNGHSQEICPAPIEDAVRDHIQETSRKIYSHLGCSGVVRMDYILAEDGLYLIEVNTIPGMTSASLVPKMVRTAGLDMTDFLTSIIENS
ncbi:MAG: D-alanine--D-alanine ligase [Bacteroidales bacterium]|nr:D-alanine--D-alanine ligase [Bacteroidales bacterium]